MAFDDDLATSTSAVNIVVSSIPGLTASSDASGNVTLRWTFDWRGGLSSNTDGYELQESTTSGTTWYPLWESLGDNDHESPRQIANPNNPKPAGNYWYRVRARKAGFFSEWSNVAKVTVTLPSSIEMFASRDNLLVYNSEDSSRQNKVYANTDLAVGNHWEYWPLTGQSVLAFQSALWFDVQSQISGRQIKQAKLQLWPYSLPGDWNTWYDARAFAGSWNGGTITFANQPNYYTSAIASVAPPVTTSLPVIWDVTAIVRNWANGTWINNGFHLADGKGEAPDYTYFRETGFYSLEYYDEANHRPKLIIELQ